MRKTGKLAGEEVAIDKARDIDFNTSRASFGFQIFPPPRF